MTQSYLIVGAKFRPPAKALLDTLPFATKLLARREPSNPHDANAIMVLVERSDITNTNDLREALVGYGKTIEELLAEPEWHLGYIPRDHAAGLAPRLDEAHIVEVPGELTFNAQGMPSIVLRGVLP